MNHDVPAESSILRGRAAGGGFNLNGAFIGSHITLKIRLINVPVRFSQLPHIALFMQQHFESELAGNLVVLVACHVIGFFDGADSDISDFPDTVRIAISAEIAVGNSDDADRGIRFNRRSPVDKAVQYEHNPHGGERNQSYYDFTHFNNL